MAMRTDAAIDHVRTLGELAQASRLARIKYLKPGDIWPTHRLVEPYELQTAPDGLLVRCWQVDPPVGEADAWRTFRADRIETVEDGGRTFTPRIPVSLSPDQAHAAPGPSAPPLPPGPARTYYEHLRAALHDNKVSRDEAAQAQSLAAALSPGQLRAVHARVFSEALTASLSGDTLDDTQAAYLRNVRKFLEMLGWGS